MNKKISLFLGIFFVGMIFSAGSAFAYSLTFKKMDTSTNASTSLGAMIYALDSFPRSGVGSCNTDCVERTFEVASGRAITVTGYSGNNNFSVFDHWTGECSGTATKCSLTMSSNKTVIGWFKPNSTTTPIFTTSSATLTVVKNGTGTGTVKSEPAGIYCGSDCSEVYAASSTVYLLPSESSSSTFAGWSGCTSIDASNTCKKVVNSTSTITATFNLASTTKYLLEVKGSGSGSGYVTSTPRGFNCYINLEAYPNDCSEEYASGTQVVLVAYPRSSSTFNGWIGCDQMSGSWCTLTMRSARTATVQLVSNVSGTSTPYFGKVYGPKGLRGNATGTWTVSVIDADGNLDRVGADWGDGFAEDKSVSGASSTVLLKHSYATYGVKQIKFQVWDKTNLMSSTSLSVNVSAPPSDYPYFENIKGDLLIKAGKQGNWTFDARDKNGNLSYLQVSWGDGTPFTTTSLARATSSVVSVSHTFISRGYKTLYFDVFDSTNLKTRKAAQIFVESASMGIGQKSNRQASFLTVVSERLQKLWGMIVR